MNAYFIKAVKRVYIIYMSQIQSQPQSFTHTHTLSIHHHLSLFTIIIVRCHQSILIRGMRSKEKYIQCQKKNQCIFPSFLIWRI